MHFIKSNRMILISSRFIRAQDEICICYDTEFHGINSTDYRRSKLKDGWEFDCNCYRCSSNREIEQRDVDAIRDPQGGNQLRSLETKIQTYTSKDRNRPWTPKTGAFCIKYFLLLNSLEDYHR